MSRILYFDIDGTLLDYDDQPKRALLQGALQSRIAAAGFAKLVCVSGWADLFASPVLKLTPDQRKLAICKLLKELLEPTFLFPRLDLTENTDDRCRSINANEDFYYIDDWADEYACRTFGKEFYEQQLGRRILRVDPFGDGSDILKWLDNISIGNY